MVFGEMVFGKMTLHRCAISFVILRVACTLRILYVYFHVLYVYFTLSKNNVQRVWDATKMRKQLRISAIL